LIQRFAASKEATEPEDPSGKVDIMTSIILRPLSWIG